MSSGVVKGGIGLILVVVSLLATGCTAYRVKQQQTDLPGVTLGLPDGKPEYAVVRIENTTEKLLFIDWADARIRGPDRFEIPARVEPSSRLSYIHPGSMVEYHLYPVQHYRHPDTTGQRRSSLSKSLVPDHMFRKFSPYDVTVFLKVCNSPSFDGCPVDAETGIWRSVRTVAVVEAVREP